MLRSGRVAIFNRPRSITVTAQTLPTPGPRQVRVRLEGCVVCGSNLPVWEGRPWFEYPRQAGSPGHEGWGSVDALGGEVDSLRVGDRVAVLSYHAFADFDLADASAVIRLPAKLDGQPFPGEALGCAMNVFRRSDLHSGEWVAIVGIGFLGAVLVGLAAKAGARVIAISRRSFARDIARRMGAEVTLGMDDAPGTLGAVRELTNGRGCPRVIEATGLQAPLDLAAELTAERGKLIIAGYHQDGLRQVNLQLWNWRGLDVVNAHERDPAVYADGVRAAADAVASGELDPSVLYTSRFRLDEIDQAFESMSDRSQEFLKALLVYD